MSKIDTLIKELCPNGVKFRSIGEVTNLVRGEHMTKDLAIEGPYPVVSASREPMGLHKDFNNSGSAVTVSSHGAYAGFVAFWPGKIWLGNNVFLFETATELSSRFLFFVLKSSQAVVSGLAKSGGVPYINASQVQRLRIPVPPLEVQQEIVRILDSFTSLESELESELEARLKQFEHFRNELFYFADTDINLIPLGEFTELVRGNGMPKSDFTELGIPAIHYGQIYTHYKTWAKETKSFVSTSAAEKLAKVEPGDIVITNTSENLEDVGKAVAWLGPETAVTGGHATVIKHRQNPKYLSYYFQTSHFAIAKARYAVGAKVIDLSAKSLAKIEIPLPNLDIQEKIVEILDAFEALTASSNSGLPAEIKARHNQYEHYRELLLTFEELEA